MNVPIVEDDRNAIRQYLLGQLTEADEEQIELRLMSDPEFNEEFDIVVDEIATAYVSGELKGDERARVEQYFLRSPERQRKAQFVRELLRQLEDGEKEPVPEVNAPALVAKPHRSWLFQPSPFSPAVSLAIALVVAVLVIWIIAQQLNPSYATFELAMTNSLRSTGSETTHISLERGIDRLRIRLRLPTPTAPQYRASLRGETVSLPELAIEAQDAESISVMVPTDEIGRGTYVIELTEIRNGSETPLRGAYVFTVD